MNAPNSIVKDMYLEITNIAQGVNLAAFVYVISSPNFRESLTENYFGPIFLSIASFLIVVLFWVRYYFDTEILNRSFTTLSAVWFFGYETAQGLSISFISKPVFWFISTGVFLFLGAGFYWLNIREISRKQKNKSMKFNPIFVNWQKARMIELGILSALSFSSAALLKNNQSLSFITGVFAIAIAIWQVVLTDDYRKKNFIDTGI